MATDYIASGARVKSRKAFCATKFIGVMNIDDKVSRAPVLESF